MPRRLIFALLFVGCAKAPPPAPPSEPVTAKPAPPPVEETLGCSFGEAIETDGKRRLALLVGVGDYESDKVPDLAGPTKDVESMYRLLTAPGGYGFPKENVCVLRDAEATRKKFEEAWTKALLERAQKDDTVLFYFAGHGSQARDTNGDEPDEMDETIMMHDARTEVFGDVVDDELNQMLTELYQRTEDITVIFDSCNSASASRGPSEDVQVRFFGALETPPDTGSSGDGGGGFEPTALPNIVVMSGARDGTSAVEKFGSGVFTSAVVKVMSRAGPKPITYAQLARRVPAIVAADSAQVPYFQGRLSRLLLSAGRRTRPLAWEITKKGGTVELAGAPMPGLSKGAVLRVYDGSATARETRDVRKRKALLVVDSYDGFKAKARPRPARAKLALGDIAVLHRPGRRSAAINVVVHTGQRAGALASGLAKQIRTLVAADPTAKKVLRIGKKRGAFVVQKDIEGRVEIIGPEGTVRNTMDGTGKDVAKKVVENLILHARQRAYLSITPEGGEDFVAHETLKVRLVPARRQESCAKGLWFQSEPNTRQITPVCHKWQVEVTLDASSPKPLHVGGLVLSNDGSIFGFPRDGTDIVLSPGQSHTFRTRFTSKPPLGIEERVRVYGTQKPVKWNELSAVAVRNVGASPLENLFLSYASGARAVGVDDEDEEPSSWTASDVSFFVAANTQRFSVKKKDGSRLDWLRREYTINRFNLGPYLPADKNTALYKVLRKAEWLTSYHRRDGLPYKQHLWKKKSDKANLKLGIDCSRSVWFVITRTGLPFTNYTYDDGYLNTKYLGNRNGPMKQHFIDCMDLPKRTGDIIVQRDSKRGDGHVVMVIDADRQIAWGSHGWDGSKGKDTGVEFQRIRKGRDWKKWDRATMKRVACWRHKKFDEEWDRPGGRPGTSDLSRLCKAPKCSVGP